MIVLKLNPEGAALTLQVLRRVTVSSDEDGQNIVMLATALETAIARHAEGDGRLLQAWRAHNLLRTLHLLAHEQLQWQRLKGREAYIETLVPGTLHAPRHFLRLWREAYNGAATRMHPLEREALGVALNEEAPPVLCQVNDFLEITGTLQTTPLGAAITEVLKDCEVIL